MTTTPPRKKRPALVPPPKSPPARTPVPPALPAAAEPPEREAGESARRGSLSWLRHAAAVEYATDQSSCTIEELHRRAIFVGINLGTFKQWSFEDKWGERRATFQKQTQEKMQRAIGDELVRRRLKTMERLDTVLDKALKKLEDEAVQMNSWEGVATVLVRLIQMMDEFHEKVAGNLLTGLTPMQSEAGGSGVVAPISQAARPRLNDDEARAAAKAIIHMRREKVRAEAAKLEAEKAAKEAAAATPTPVAS